MCAPRRRDCLTWRGEPGGAFAEQNDGPAILAEFRAGRLLKEGNIMKPDLTKGKLQTCHGDDGLIHFQWVDRETNVVHEDLIVFPGDAKLVPMAQKRCWMLEFAQGTPPHFRRRRVSVPPHALAIRSTPMPPAASGRMYPPTPFGPQALSTHVCMVGGLENSLLWYRALRRVWPSSCLAAS
jgi:hypothetical protein